MIRIHRVCSVEEELLAAFERLLPQLTQASIPTAEELRALLDSGSVLLAAIENGQMVGLGCLCVFRSPSGLHAHIEDVVVEESQRGKGIGEALVLGLVEEGRRLGLKGISLTCNPRREAANRLYGRLGFKQWQTNNYWLELGGD
jgi:GNAT superfamily N-acetyltransferase